ncbi:MAG: WG repeat-containing protein [Phycisphaerales bacterium]
MRHLCYKLCFITALLLCVTHARAETDDAVFGPPESQAVEFDPQRYIDPLELLPIQVNGYWGYADRRGDIVIAPRFEWTDYFYGPFIYGVSKSGRLGAWVARYRSGGESGLMVFYQKDDGSKTYIKADDVKIGGTSGVNPDRYSEGYTVVARWVNGRQRDQVTRDLVFGTIDVTYAHALRMSDGFAAVQEELCGFIDQRGKVVIPMQYAVVRSFHDGFAAVRLTDARGGAWGFIDKAGRYHFQDKAGEVQELRSYSEGLAPIKARGKWGFMDKAQRVRVDPVYDEVRGFADGRAAVRRGDVWGYIDVTGKEVAFGFDGAWDFDIHERSGLQDNSDKAMATPLGLIRQGDGYGYINQVGEISLPARYRNAMPFFRGVARVACGEGFAYITQAGRPAWDPRRVAAYGIQGLQTPDAVEPKWLGLPGHDGQPGEPYPFEYDAPDHLAYNQQHAPNDQDSRDRQQDPTPSEPDARATEPELRRGSNR